MSEQSASFAIDAVDWYRRYVAAVPTDRSLAEYRRVMALTDPTERARQACQLAGRQWAELFGAACV